MPELLFEFLYSPLIFYNISKMASIEVKLITSPSQAQIQVVVSAVLICLPISVCIYVCPAFLVYSSALSGNRPCLQV